jgi:tRNA-specific 2-thiouridylase
MTIKSIRVAVGLSGGVDSSVAAALLQREGYDVIGITMEIFDGALGVKETTRHACYGPGEKEDVEAAASVCKTLGIPFQVIDLRKEYAYHVVDYVRREYLEGRTPNPCVVCNERLKFGFLLERAREAGLKFDFFATGHYAKVENNGDRFLLKRAFDRSKDQTYFLYALPRERLSRLLFPLGSYTKEQVREMGRSFGLETADRPESQDFIGGGDYSSLFNDAEIKKGQIVDEEGHILGNHRGIIYYTLGQRRGLGIASERPLYVLKIDAAKNRLVVGHKSRLFSRGLIATDTNLIPVDTLEREYGVTAKIRLNHRGAHATVVPHGKNKAMIRFDEPQLAVTPGQAVVLYLDDIVFGGGTIERTLG